MTAPELETAALRRLAHGLLFDADAAADAVQDAWLAALRKGREPAGPWLAGAVRRIALGARRADRRRDERERGAAKPESRTGESPSERIEILRALLAALERLDEPFRAAVVMRYLDDLPPREIARRSGVPVDTARSRVRRGLERLRADLDGPRGPGREALLGALGPWFAHEVGGSAMTAATAWIGAHSMQLSLAFVLALIGGTFGWRWMRDPASPSLEPLALASTTAAAIVPDTVEDIASATESTQDAGETRAEVVSSATYEVTGVVLRDSREPLPGGHVRVRARRGVGLAGEVLYDQRMRADTGGVFHAMLEPFAEAVTIEVQQDEPGHWGHASWMVVPAGDASWGSWSIYAWPLDLQVTGLVIDEQGAGIAGARIAQESYFCERSTTTDAEGRFSLLLSSRSGPVELVVEAKGLGRMTTRLEVEGLASMDLEPIELPREARVEGRIVDAEGQPVAGARVLRSTFTSTPWSTSDEEGRFVLEGIDPAARKPWLRIEHPDYALLAQGVETFEAPTILTLQRGAWLSGRVRTSSGTPVANAWLRLGTTGGADHGPGTVTDDQGRFRFEHVGPDNANLWIWAQGHASTRHSIALEPGVERVDGIEIALEPQQVLRGRLVDDAGSPVAWGVVYVQDSASWNPKPKFDSIQVRSDAEGRFRISGLPSGPVVAGAVVNGFARLEVTLPDSNASDVVLRLARAASIAGRVVDATTGQPIQQFHVVVNADWEAPLEHRLESGPAWWRGMEIASPEGVWRMQDELPADRWVKVEVSAQGYAPAAIVRAVTAVDPDPEALVVRLERQTLVHGRVTDPDGAPVIGALVSSAGRKDGPTATSDADGRFELRGLPTGTTTLAIQAEGFARRREGPIELGGTSVRLDIALDRGARLSGRVLADDGRPLEGERIQLLPYDGGDLGVDRETLSDAEGRYAFELLASGTFDLHWTRSNSGETMPAQSQRIDVAGAEEHEFDLGLSGAATLNVSIQSEVTLPVDASVQIMVMAEFDPKRARTFESARGQKVSVSESVRRLSVKGDSFQVRGMKPGRYMLSANAEIEPGSFVSGVVREIELKDGQTVDVEVLMQAPPPRAR